MKKLIFITVLFCIPVIYGYSQSTATVQSGNGGFAKTYTIEFVPSSNFFDGVVGSYARVNNLHYQTGTNFNNGIYWGDGCFRQKSSGNGYYTTPVLTGGAGTLSFWVRRYNSVGSKRSVLKVLSSADNYAVPLKEVKASVLTNNWQEITVAVNIADPSLRLRIAIDRIAPNDALDFCIDDILVTPCDGVGMRACSTSLDITSIDIFNVYSSNRSIVIEVKEQSDFMVYNIKGSLISSGKVDGMYTVDMKEGGIYFVKVGDKTAKVLVK